VFRLQKGPSWWKLRSKFTCPHCATPLSAKTTGAFIAPSFFGFWLTFRELFLFATSAPKVLLLFRFVFVSGAVGWGWQFLIVGSFSYYYGTYAP